MSKRWLLFLLMLCPLLAMADSTVSFTPPTTDYSVGWLANIFGIVDGVLHGDGSQIVGRMFEIFNAAVMALGGIIITYTMMVSTMNTAHEGEMLGKKWSSMWVPVRATAGFALLVPKASGYCLLQVFVMWVVVQGVGAADKLWNAALSYLNRGGVIIQVQKDPTIGLTGDTPTQNITGGAITILSGQVCMIALERVLKHRLAAIDTTNCKQYTDKYMNSFCEQGSVPSFIDSVDIVAANRLFVSSSPSPNPSASVDMPNFNSSGNAFYSSLSGICGKISWHVNISATSKPIGGAAAAQGSGGVSENTLRSAWSSDDWGIPQDTPLSQSAAQAENEQDVAQNEAGLSASEMSVARNARAAAIQQMYSDLQLVAQVMINNDPASILSLSTSSAKPTASLLTSSTTLGTEMPATPMNALQAQASLAQNASSTPAPFAPWATESFGVPLDNQGNACVNNQTFGCNSWGVAEGTGASLALSSGGASAGVLLNGTELKGSVMDYMGVMGPTLVLLAESSNQVNVNKSKAFIQLAESRGWIMAGSYFFDLVLLNNINISASDSSAGDTNSGLEKSTFDISKLGENFNQPCPAVGALCSVLDGNYSSIYAIYGLFNGWSYPFTSADTPPGVPGTTTFPAATVSAPTITSVPETISGTDATAFPATSVFGYIQNALVLQIPGQPNTPPLAFANMMHSNFQGTNFTLPPAHFSCMGVTIVFVELCIGRWIGTIVYDGILVPVMKAIGSWLMSLVYGIVMNALMIPLNAMAAIFTQGVKILDVPGINPIVALANMGTYYINFVGKLWFVMILGQLIAEVVSYVGIVLVPILIMALPITIAWSIIMLGVGFICAYYVPMIPYMIFTFGAVAWFMAVIEAMVAAPIVALGVIHPEGHDIFGKGEAAIMILMNVFLRPSMMIIGYITAISLSYVGIWFLNAGFDHAISFIQQSNNSYSFGSVDHAAIQQSTPGSDAGMAAGAVAGAIAGGPLGALLGSGAGHQQQATIPSASAVSGGYTQWAGVFAFFFSILIYTTIYMTIVEKAFTLISMLPDKILRWIGGQPEAYGSDSAQWAGEVKKGVESAAKESGNAMVQAGKAAQGALPSGESSGEVEITK